MGFVVGATRGAGIAAGRARVGIAVVGVVAVVALVPAICATLAI